MGTGVGEAALAAEAIGAAEAAGAIGGGAGFLEGMAGVSALEGAGVAGLGLGTGAGLGTALAGAGAGAGGLGALSPAFQTALGQTAAVMPEVATQVAQATGAGAVPTAGTSLGTGQLGYFADVGGTGVSSGLPFPTGGMGVQPPLPSLSPATAADVAQAMDAGFNPATATTEMGGNLARQMMNYVDPADMARASVNAAEAAKSPFFNPLTSLYNIYKEQDPLTQSVMKYGGLGLGGLQAAKYLNKPQGVAAPEKYNGPLSKFTYSPDTYRPYTYKPYAAGGPVEMERMAEGGSASSGDSGGAAAGDTGIAALGPMMYSPAMMSSSLVDPAAEYAAAQPTMDMSRQNFQNFLAPYQNMPVTEAAPPSEATPPGAATLQASPNAAYYPAGSSYANMSDAQLVEAARKVYLNPTPNSQRELEAIQGNNPAPVSDPWGYEHYQRGYYIQLAAGGPVEEMSRENAIGANTGYPQADIQQGAYATPWQTPVSRNVVANAGDVGVDQMTGMERMAGGGIANLGGYSDGGRLLKGPGDGMSDNIPATIGRKQPARLADGEFVVPADVVSGLGNGSTEAGAKQLYKMLDKVRSARTGTKKQGKQIKPEKYTPA